MMFDTYLVARPTSTTTHVTVKEQRAPTDESVKLLNEMQKAAEENIRSSLRLDNNELKCVVWCMKDACAGGIRIKVQFRLNGRERTEDFLFTPYVEPPNIGREIVERLSRIIAEDILSEIGGAIAHGITV